MMQHSRPVRGDQERSALSIPQYPERTAEYCCIPRLHGDRLRRVSR